MSIRKAAAIVGVGDVETVKGRVPGEMSVLQVQALAAKRALDDAGLTFEDVDGLFTAGFWGMPGDGMFGVMTLAEYLGIRPKYMDSTQIGGCSFEAHVGHAAAAIKAGLIDVALIVYGSTQKTRAPSEFVVTPPYHVSQYEIPYGIMLPMTGYAMAAHRHMHEFGTKPEQLAEIAVATRKWAQLNPAATMRDPLTIEDVMNSPVILDPLRLYDCCLVTDGGGAVVLVSPERARDCKKKPIWVLGYGEAMSHYSVQQFPDMTITSAAESGRRAFEMAGVTHDDIDVVEIYDSFTITVLMTLESLGFCKVGEGGDFVSNQRTAPGGDFPLNTNGGGLSYGHPGMYGIFLLIEAVRQLRGECGERQVKDAKLALAAGTGCYLSSTSVVILGRD